MADGSDQGQLNAAPEELRVIIPAEVDLSEDDVEEIRRQIETENVDAIKEGRARVVFLKGGARNEAAGGGGGNSGR